MFVVQNSDFISSTKSISKSASGLVILIGMVVIIGWLFDLPVLKSVFPNLVSMKANTALAFILCGISLWCLSGRETRRWQFYFVTSCAVMIALLGGLSLAQYLFRIDLGIDQLLFKEPVGAIETSHLGRMAPATAFNFLLIGISLLLDSQKVYRAARVLIAVMAAIALFSFWGYLFGLSSLHNLGPFTSMALNTSITFILVAVSMMSMRVIFDTQYIIRSGFWVAVVTLLYIGIISYWNTVSQIADAKQVTHSQEALQKIEHILSDIKDMETASRGYIITGNEKYLDPYYAQYNCTEADIVELRRLNLDNIDQQQHIDFLEPILKEKIAFISKAIAIRKTKGFEAAIIEQYQTPHGDSLMNEIRFNIGEMIKGENNSLQVLKRKSEESSYNAVVTLIAGNAISFVILLSVFMLLLRENRVRRNAEDEIRELNIGLEKRVDERTLALKKSYEALQESEERYRTLFENAQVGIYRTTPNGSILSANPALIKMLGYLTFDDLAKRNLEEDGFEPDYQRNSFKELIERTGEIIGMEAKWRRADGGWIFVRENARVIKDVNGKIKYYEGTVEDITERKQSEEAIKKSEEKFRTFADYTYAWEYWIDPNGKSVYVSPSCKNITGYSPADFESDQELLRKIIHTDDKQLLDDHHKKFNKDMPVDEIDFRIIRRDGTERWISHQCHPVWSSEGKWLGRRASNNDITERKKAEQEILILNNRLQVLISAIQELASARDLETVMAVVRSYARKLTGSDGATFILREGDFCYYADEDAISQLWKGQRFPLSNCISGWVILNKAPAVIEDIYSDPRIPIDAYMPTFVKSLAMVPIRTHDPLGAVGNYWAKHYRPSGMELLLVQTLADATARTVENVRLLDELEQRVMNRTAQLETANKELEAFSYSVSHDLRAPLRSIDGFSNLLLKDYADKVDDEGKNYLHRVRNASQRMGILIDDLLNLSRITRVEMQNEKVDLSMIVRTITDELSKTHPDRKVKFVIAKDMIVKGDSRLLYIALENLLNNAWKFTRNQSAAKIEFGAIRPDDKLAYFISDNGAGFDMSYADKLFGAFQRLHSNTEFEGTGIGLATVQRIIRRHGGKIWAEGKVGEGATFYFTL